MYVRVYEPVCTEPRVYVHTCIRTLEFANAIKRNAFNVIEAIKARLNVTTNGITNTPNRDRMSLVLRAVIS